MAEDFIKQLVMLNEKEVLDLAQKRIDSGEDPMNILDDSREAMAIIGKKFETEEMFIPELIFAGEILKGITSIVKPKLTGSKDLKSKGKVIIGTVEGDIHDIGKNVVCFLLEISGFEVYDLGVDVPAEVFVNKIKETGAKVVGMSGFLTFAFDVMRNTNKTIADAGLREGIKIMIGGTQMGETIVKYIGADEYGKDAMSAVRLAEKWYK